MKKNIFLTFIILFISFNARAEFDSLFVCDVVGNDDILVEIFYDEENELVKLVDTKDRHMFIQVGLKFTGKVENTPQRFMAKHKMTKVFAYFSRKVDINKITGDGTFKRVAKGLQVDIPTEGLPIWLGKSGEVDFKNCF